MSIRTYIFRIIVTAFAVLTVLLGIGIDKATAYTKHLSLSQVSSVFAQRQVAVRCYEKTEADSPWGHGAWGYVEMPTGKAKWTALDSRICEGALNINDESLPEWQRALGVSVLVHESYHLRRWSANHNEAKVECKAIRHWKVGARMLGATEETIEDIWGTALATHYRLADWVDDSIFSPTYGERPYYDPDCKVPHYLPPDVLDG